MTSQGSLQGFVKHILDEEYTKIRTVTSKTIQKQIKTVSKPFPQPCYIYTTRTIACTRTYIHTCIPEQEGVFHYVALACLGLTEIYLSLPLSARIRGVYHYCPERS